MQRGESYHSCDPGKHGVHSCKCKPQSSTNNRRSSAQLNLKESLSMQLMVLLSIARERPTAVLVCLLQGCLALQSANIHSIAHCSETEQRGHGEGMHSPAARSRYRTPRFSAAIGCRTMLLMMPRKMTDAYKAPSTLVMPISEVTCPPSFQKMKLQVGSSSQQVQNHPVHLLLGGELFALRNRPS